jgi:ribosomal protein S12 methylthiotransferase accessory factor YcaO
MTPTDRTSNRRRETMAMGEGRGKAGSKAAAFLSAIGEALKRHYRAGRL